MSCGRSLLVWRGSGDSLTWSVFGAHDFETAQYLEGENVILCFVQIVLVCG